ncbi:MAG TPA: LysR family transcriptional regulator [Burkholderiales bacterium]|nr:LysR family transcriptional regulator [Burkholderiales bacterium]
MDRLTAMELFVRVVETGSFSAVARQMDMTQPTVSKQLAALEQRLKTRLLNRSTRQLSLTEAGTSYYEACKRILDSVNEAEGNVGRLQGQFAGQLRINTSIALGQMYVATLVLKFQEQHPDIEIDLSLADRFVDVVEEGIDLAIRVGKLTDSSLVARRIGKARRLAIATHAYLKRHGMPKVPQDLAEHNCILYAYLSTGNEWMFRGPEGEIRVRVSGNFRANNGDAIRQAVLADHGIAVVPEWIVGGEVAAGRIKVILPDFEPTPMDISAVYPSARHVSAKLRALIDFLQTEFPKIPALRAG